MIDSYNFMVNSPPCQNLKEGNGSFLQGLRYTTIPILRSTDAIGNLIRTSVMERLPSYPCSRLAFRFNKSTIKNGVAKALFYLLAGHFGIENERITNEHADDFQHEWSRIGSIFYVSSAQLATPPLHFISGSA